MRNGRPLRFLALTLGGWTGLRAVVLWQAAMPREGPLRLVGEARASEGGGPAPWRRGAVGLTPTAPLPAVASAISLPVAAPRRALPPPGVVADPPPPFRRDLSGIALAPTAQEQSGAVASLPQRGAIFPPLPPTPIARGRSRLAGSAWLIARSGDAAPGGALGGQLGASQAGARLTYALGTPRRVALSARLAAPLRGNGREAAFGLDWQPTRAPVHLIAEQRVSLDGGPGGSALLAVAGLDPTPVAAGFRLEAYAQAGAITRAAADGGVEGFGDGAARLTRPLATLGRLRLDLGAGAWGGAQRGARRLDVGPTVGVVAPLGGRAMRLALDWRERVGGDAAPDSGPALSLGSDF